jgi:hypothetical protein
MPILTQAQIEAESRSKWAPYLAIIQQELLRKSLADFDKFIGGVFEMFPDLGQYKPNSDGINGRNATKQHHDYHKECRHDFEKAFDPSQITTLERMFRDMYGKSKAVDLLNMAERWSESAMPNGGVNQSGYWNKGYYRAITDTFRNAYKELFSVWEQLRKRKVGPETPPIPLAIDESSKFQKLIFENGYDRVTSLITKQHLPSIQQIMLGLGKDGKTWQDIAAELNQLGGADAYHWTRLVRSEMVMAAQKAKLEQGLELEEVNIKWSASRMGATCPICLERDGMIMDPKLMGDDAYYQTATTALVQGKRELPIGMYPHPNCRCTMSYTYHDANWEPN